MRAWRYEWDQRYWTILCNIVDAFRRHVPYEEFQALQAELIKASHDIANNAENLHPGKGWKQYATKIEAIKKAITTIQENSVVSQAVKLESFMHKDIVFAEVKFCPGTDWFKNVLVPRVGERDAEREFVIMKCEPRVLAVPGFSPGGEIKIPTDEKIVLSVKYYE